jgi:hypothetical protein
MEQKDIFPWQIEDGIRCMVYWSNPTLLQQHIIQGLDDVQKTVHQTLQQQIRDQYTQEDSPLEQFVKFDAVLSATKDAVSLFKSFSCLKLNDIIQKHADEKPCPYSEAKVCPSENFHDCRKLSRGCSERPVVLLRVELGMTKSAVANATVP